jgi:hypothetical protein
MPEDPKKHYREILSSKLQLGGLIVCILLAALFTFGAYQLLAIAPSGPDNSPPPFATVLRWALTAGFVGGAGRSLYRFIWEVGGCADDYPSYFINKWFLYLVKPVMGSAGGLFFFLAVNLGLVGILSEKGATLSFDRVCFTAVLGGIFFEDVFALLAPLVAKRPSGPGGPPPPMPS